MLYVLESKIEIGAYTFRNIHEVEFEKSVDTLADTATIKLPTRFKVKKGDDFKYTEEVIKVGDPVSITVGYENEYKGEEFLGYVKAIKPTIPVEIHCEDAFWLLRRKNITKAWKGKVMLKEILEEVVKDTGLKLASNIPVFPIDNFIIKNANGAKVVQRLKQDFRVSAFINDQNELYCGLRQLTNIGQIVDYDLQYNLVENNLEFKTKEERQLRIRYTYIAPDGKRKKVEVGDPDGELRTFHTSVVSSVSKLKEMAKASIEKLKYDGFEGNVVSFLIPFATRGMKARIFDKDYPHREGSYFIKKVHVTFNTEGARRTVSLGTRL